MIELFKELKTRIKAVKSLDKLYNTIKPTPSDESEQSHHGSSKSKKKTDIYKHFKVFSKAKKEENKRIHKEDTLLKHISNQVTLNTNEKDMR